MDLRNYFSSIYIHVPFCKSKCPFCYAATEVLGNNSSNKMDKYCQSLITEMAMKKEILLSIPELNQADCNTIKGDGDVFLGGGTPSLLNPKHFRDIIIASEKYFNIEPGKSLVTLELMPDKFEDHYFEELNDAFINRLSIAAQTFDNKTLKQIGRKHTAEDSIKCFEDANKFQFKDILCEIMWGMQPNNINLLRDDIIQGINAGASSFALYWYNVFEKDYILDKQKQTFLKESYYRGIEVLLQNGFIQTSFSRFSKTSNKIPTYIANKGPGITSSERGNILGIGWGAQTFFGKGVGYYNCDFISYMDFNTDLEYKFELFEDEDYETGVKLLELFFNQETRIDDFNLSEGNKKQTSRLLDVFNYFLKEGAIFKCNDIFTTTFDGRALMDYHMHKAWLNNRGGRFDKN